jgi:hypothetical protein
VPLEACSEKVCGRVSDRKRRTWPELDHTSLRGEMATVTLCRQSSFLQLLQKFGLSSVTNVKSGRQLVCHHVPRGEGETRHVPDA